MDTAPTFEFPAVCSKKITAAFDGGVTLLAAIEHRLGIAEPRATPVPDTPDLTRITHRLGIEIGLERLDSVIEVLVQFHAEELVRNGAVKALHKAVGL